MKEITAYQCSWCSFQSLRKEYVERHETWCSYNPKKRTCNTCKNHKTSKGFGGRVHCSAGVEIPRRLGITHIKKNCSEWVPQEDKEI